MNPTSAAARLRQFMTWASTPSLNPNPPALALAHSNRTGRKSLILVLDFVCLDHREKSVGERVAGQGVDVPRTVIRALDSRDAVDKIIRSVRPTHGEHVA